jgi:hypothetical protein
MTAWLRFATVCISGALAASCSDFFGDVPDPGASGPVEGGPRSFGYAGSFNGAGGSFNNVCNQPPCPSNGVGGSNVIPVSKSTVLASGLNAYSIALDDQYVYATSDQGLVRVPKSGGNVTPIGILQQGGFPGVAVDTTSVYYVNNNGAIESVPKEGGPTKVVVPAGMGGGGGSLVFDGDTFYYIVGPYLRRAPASGGAFTELANMVQQGGNQANRLAVDAMYVYFVSFANGQTTQSVSAVPKTGGSVQTLEPAKGTIGALAAGNGGVVYTDIYAFGTTKVDLKVSIVGGQTAGLTGITVTGGSPNVGGALAIDTGKLQAYFTGAPGLVRYNGSLETLDATVQPAVIVLDATDVYFADWGGSGGPSPSQPGIKKIAR